MKSKISTLQRRIDRIQQKLQQLGDLRPGTLSEQYNVCGNPRCRCKETPPKKHGPYHQLSWNRKRKNTTRFIRPQSVAAVKEQLKNYHELRDLVDQWIDAAQEICELRLQQDRERDASSSG